MKTWMLPLVALTFALSPMTYAAGGDQSGGKADRMDENAMNAPSFQQMDANGDGKISEDELNVYGSSAAGKAKAQEENRMMKMHEMDLDGDGNISNDEYEKGMMSK
jgi:Ca2+-binding EF-hand superfamily protein